MTYYSQTRVKVKKNQFRVFLPSYPYLPAAFFEIIELAINGIQATVPVMSLMLYKILSAGTMVSVCPTMQQPTLSTTFKMSALDRFVLNPGIDSNLSRVPPVNPNDLPDIIGT